MQRGFPGHTPLMIKDTGNVLHPADSRLLPLNGSGLARLHRRNLGKPDQRGPAFVC